MKFPAENTTLDTTQNESSDAAEITQEPTELESKADLPTKTDVVMLVEQIVNEIIDKALAEIDAQEAKEQVPAPINHYQKGFDIREQATESDHLLEAINHFELANSFAGFYAIGEMYQHGVSRVYRGNPIRLDPNIDKAVDYFIKAHEAHATAIPPTNADNETKNEVISSPTKLEIKVLWDTETIPNLCESFDINKLNDTLDSAKLGHPEALFQLALFYELELKNYNKDECNIASALPLDLTKWMIACLESAASLHHPHAAYKLIKQFRSEIISSDNKLKYSLIAADPYRYREVTMQHFSTLLTYRGNKPLTNPIMLDPPLKTLPPELTETKTLNGSKKIGGIFNTSVNHASKACKLPTKHYPAKKAATANLTNQTSATALDDMRAKRLAAYANKATALTVAPSTTSFKVTK